MKSRRIKTNGIILFGVVLSTGFLFRLPFLYPESVFSDDILDFIGLLVTLFGTLIRMSARGHKKVQSPDGRCLVTTGPYSIVRHPMYWGTFLISRGFILILWPWWALFIWACLFYLRFKSVIIKEENHLQERFGDAYESYAEMIPAIFPKWLDFRKKAWNQIFPIQEIWKTDEKRGLVLWPLLAVFLEIFQEYMTLRGIL